MQKYYVEVLGEQDTNRPRTCWYLDSKSKVPHRLGGPAVECANGDYAWYVNGERHRTDGPALVQLGDKHWYVDGKRHRVGAPAIEYADGTTEWYHDGKLHRADGPTYEGTSGYKAWWVDGKRHRVEGPALVICSPGFDEWWLDGEQVTEEEHARRTQPAQEMTVAQIEAALGHKIKIVK